MVPVQFGDKGVCLVKCDATVGKPHPLAPPSAGGTGSVVHGSDPPVSLFVIVILLS